MSLVHRDGGHVYYLLAMLGLVPIGFRRTLHAVWFSVFVLVTQLGHSLQSGFELSLTVCLVGFSATLLAAFGCGLYLRELADEESNALLHDMWPAPVVERLKTQGQYTQRCDSVTVLFADMVGFTALTYSMNAAERIDHLHDLLSRFDAAASEFHLEKIKTIGNCYMAICDASDDEP